MKEMREATAHTPRITAKARPLSSVTSAWLRAVLTDVMTGGVRQGGHMTKVYGSQERVNFLRGNAASVVEVEVGFATQLPFLHLVQGARACTTTNLHPTINSFYHKRKLYAASLLLLLLLFAVRPLFGALVPR
ncbi:hypothetical protein INR49_027619 [Caranx melampygus]|nr:hypothetical protein INR49_027619 [Caranx melampygus]